MIRQSNPVRAAAGACAASLAVVAAFSLAVNLLTLASPLYMMQLFDRVLSSRSGETLFYLSAHRQRGFGGGDVSHRRGPRPGAGAGWHLARRAAGAVGVRRCAGGRAQERSVARRDRLFGSSSGARRHDRPVGAAAVRRAVVADLRHHPVSRCIRGWAARSRLGGIVTLSALAVLNEVATRQPLRLANSTRACARVSAPRRRCAMPR